MDFSLGTGDDNAAQSITLQEDFSNKDLFTNKCKSLPHLAKYFVPENVNKNWCEDACNSLSETEVEETLAKDNLFIDLGDFPELEKPTEGFESNSDNLPSFTSSQVFSPIPSQAIGKTPASVKLRNSLGASFRGRDMSWNSSMETPIVSSTPCGGFKRKRTPPTDKRVMLPNPDLSPDMFGPVLDKKPEELPLKNQSTPKRSRGKTPKAIAFSQTVTTFDEAKFQEDSSLERVLDHDEVDCWLMTNGCTPDRSNEEDIIPSQMMRDMDLDFLEDIPPKVTFGFSTGKGKQIQVSKEAEERVKSLFDNLGPLDEDLPDDVLGGFGPPGKIDPPESTKAKMVSCGFSTASGKKVVVSEQALEAARANWTDTTKDLPEPDDRAPNPVISEPPCKVKQKLVFEGLETPLKDKPESPAKKAGKRTPSPEKCSRVSLRDFVKGLKPNALSRNKLRGLGLKDSTMDLRIANSESLVFSNGEDFPTGELVLGKFQLNPAIEGLVMLDDISRAFLESEVIESKLVSEEWVRNHFRWITWKMAATEVSFADQFAGRYLNVENVLRQLEHRYVKEVENSKRSALKRITERDDSASKTMVLCVSAIEGPTCEGVALELTDSWYSVRAVGDTALLRLVNNRRIRVGDKLAVHGAELVGCPDGCPPLEAPRSLYLRIHANSTRRARWFAKLGYLGDPRPFPVPLCSLFADGGTVSRCDVVISRVYPMQYRQRNLDGRYLYLNEAGAARVQRKLETKREDIIETIKQRVQKKYNKMATGSGDGNEDQKFLDAYNRDVELEMEKRQIKPKEDSLSILKVRVVGTHWQDVVKRTNCMLSVWRASEDVESALSEGKTLRIYYLNTCKPWSQNHGNDVELRSTKLTQFAELANVDTGGFSPRKLTCLRVIGSLGFSPVHNEVDVVGFVVYVGDAPSGDGKNFQTIYLSDEKQNLVGIKFWGGLKEFYAENTVEMKTALLACNLQWRSLERTTALPYLHATEYSGFTQKPKNPAFRKAVADLQATIKDLDSLVKEAGVRIHAAQTSTRNVCTGQVSRNASVRKKIAYLSQYRDPPPLVQYAANSSSEASTKFRSPTCCESVQNETL